MANKPKNWQIIFGLKAGPTSKPSSKIRFYCFHTFIVSACLQYQRDASYAWNGRASLLVRFLEEAVQNNFREFTTIKTETLSANAIVPLNGARQKTKSLTALFVVGGLTRAEISGKFFLIKQPTVFTFQSLDSCLTIVSKIIPVALQLLPRLPQ